jgi:hypothetical protein
MKPPVIDGAFVSSAHPKAMSNFEKFAPHELKALREELMESTLDSFHVAELLSGFLTQHGYGVSHYEARTAASEVEIVGCTLPRLQEELEKLAFVM